MSQTKATFCIGQRNVDGKRRIAI